MGAKRVGDNDNGHTAHTYGNPLGVECEGCGRRALVALDRLGSIKGDMRALLGRPFKCSACGLRDVSLWLFAVRAEADAWAEDPVRVFKQLTTRPSLTKGLDCQCIKSFM